MGHPVRSAIRLAAVSNPSADKVFNVYYLNRDSGRTCRYCVSPMDYATAVRMRDAFNARYPQKAYPNGKGFYPFAEAYIAGH